VLERIQILASAVQTSKGASAAQFLRERALAVLGFVLGIGIAGVCGLQAREAWRSEAIEARAETVATRASQTLGGYVTERQRALGEALLHPEVERYYLNPSLGDARVRGILGQRLPDVIDLRFVGNDVLKEIGEDVARFGYANAEMLLSAARMGTPAPAQVHSSGGVRQFVLVHPVTIDGVIVGFVLAKFPYEALRAAYFDLPREGLEFSLLQGSVDSPSEVLEGGALRGGRAVAVPGSTLYLGYRVPEPFYLLGPRGSTANLISAVIGALVAVVVLFWRRKMALVDWLRRRQRADQSIGDVIVPAPPQASKPVTAPSPAFAAASTEQTQAPAAAPAAKTTPEAPTQVGAIDRSLFRAYDIRGVVGSTLTPAVTKLIGRAIGSEVRARELLTVVVGRDGRLSSPDLAKALIDGLLAAGCDVIDIGAVPTPLLYYAVQDLSAGSGVMVTGSHNPPEYNGFKIVVAGETLAEKDIQTLFERIVENRLDSGRGALTQIDVADSYIDRISGDIQLETPLRVVIDCGNGIPGAIAPRLFEAIGCEVIPLYCEVDGHFPNHHPDPSEPHNLQDLVTTVKQFKADLGLAFDGDGDRLGVVTPKGQIIYPDRLLMLFARDVLLRSPGATIIYDVKCTGHLSRVIIGHGGSPVMWKTGHSLIKKKMKETGAELAGEMSGHFFFKERWFGFDDGLYSGCRLLEILAMEGRDIDEVFEEFPKSVSTPELKVTMTEGEHYRFIEKFKQKAKFEGARITTIDGIRADWPDGWGLVRCSNTTPSLVLRFDADDGDALARIQDSFRQQLLAVDPKLSLPF
jgi:phosphomannomutase/phosphoglucomutase